MEKIEISSNIFGVFSLGLDNIVHFKHGIPGLEKITDYGMVSIEEYDPIIWMISTDGVYHFPLVKINSLDINDFDKDSKNHYKLMLDKALREMPEFVPYIILKLDQTVREVSLQAPILINPQKNIGLQLVFDKSSNE